MPRTNAAAYRRRNEQARAEGWDSYGQKRLWLPRLGGLKRRSELTGDEVATIQRLSDEWGRIEKERADCLLCRPCSLAVNNGGDNHGGPPPPIMWQARLVTLTLAKRRRSRAARRGHATRRRMRRAAA